METVSPATSISGHQDEFNNDELSMNQSMVFSDSLMDLKSLRSQLYSAAEYFELSYANDDQKQIVVNTLKDYAVKALVNTVDHLGSMSYKVNDLLDVKVDEVSGAELRVSCIEQRLQTYQSYIDREGLSQQTLVITAPKYHKRYILPGKSMPDSAIKAAVTPEDMTQTTLDTDSELLQAAIRSRIRDRPPPSRKARSPSPAPRARSSSPSHRRHCPSPSSRSGKLFSTERKAESPLRTSNAFLRSGSNSSKPSVLNSSSGRQHPSEPRKSASMRLHAERDDCKVAEQNSGKTRGFLKSLLTRHKSRNDEMLYSYLDEY